MGMRVGASGGDMATNAAAWQQRQQNMQALNQALQSGNLDAAKSAYATLMKNAPQRAAQSPNNPLAQIGKALGSGDLAGAQQAMSAMRSRHAHQSEVGESGGSTEVSAGWRSATLGNNLNTVA